MAFVPNTSGIVLFGGYTDARPLGDSWSYDGTSWSPITVPTGLVAREHVFAVTDSARGRAVLFGGFTRPRALADTWTFGDAQAPTLVEHGVACGAIGSVPGLSVAVPPWQGEVFQVDLDVPNAIALPLLALGSTANPPLDLSPFGAPGCHTYFNVGAPHWLIPLTSQGCGSRIEQAG